MLQSWYQETAHNRLPEQQNDLLKTPLILGLILDKIQLLAKFTRKNYEIFENLNGRWTCQIASSFFLFETYTHHHHKRGAASNTTFAMSILCNLLISRP